MEAIIVAVITAIGGILAVLVQKGRKENTRDHGMVVVALGRIEEKIDDHIVDHAKGELRWASRTDQKQAPEHALALIQLPEQQKPSPALRPARSERVPRSMTPFVRTSRTIKRQANTLNDAMKMVYPLHLRREIL